MGLSIKEGVQAHCSAHRQFSYVLTWLPEKNYVPGTEVEIRAGNFRQHYEWNVHYLEIEKAEVLFSPHVNRSGPDVFQNRKQRIICRSRLLQMVRKGEPVTIKLTATPSMFAGVDLELFVWVREPLPLWAAKETDLRPVEREEDKGCRLTVLAGPVERLSVYSHPAPGAYGKVRTCLVPEDRYGNPLVFAKPVTAAWTWRNVATSATLHQSAIIELDAPEEPEILTVRIRMDELSIYENISNGLVDGEYLVVNGNPVLPQGRQGLLPVFGDFHWHTQEVSDADGGRPMADAFTSARDDLNLNFAAPGDHCPEGLEWDRTVRIVDSFNQDDRFATFFGWEHSTNRGHENYYFTDPKHAPVWGEQTGFRPENLETAEAQLETYRDFIAVPHHTNSNATLKKDGIPAWHQYNWTEPREYRRLVEIVQNRGNQERNDYTDAWRGLVHNHFASVQDALKTGHKLGFTGGTDNHTGWPGRVIYEKRKSVILTGVWTQRVERGSLFQALWNRHTWAVCDTRAIVWFSINGVLMGGDLRLSEGEEMTAHIQIHAESPLQSLEIVSEGSTVWSAASSSPRVDVQVPLGAFRHSTHFYVRALQRDGGFMYASPVFAEKG